MLTSSNVTIDGFGKVTFPFRLVPSESGGNTIDASLIANPDNLFRPGTTF